MKRNAFLLFLLLTCQYGLGQQYLRLSDGAIDVNNRCTTMPTRTIEDVKDGIMVTYEFDYVSKNPDNIFPSSSILFFDGFGIGGIPEKPALPIKWDTFYIPSEKDYSINVIDSSYIELPIEIAPARPPMVNSSHSIYTSDNVPPIKPYVGFYPQNTIDSKINLSPCTITAFFTCIILLVSGAFNTLFFALQYSHIISSESVSILSS